MIDQHDRLGDLLTGLSDSQLANGCVLTIGNFDGVHQGHRAIIRRVVDEAKRLGVPAAVLTFEPHPKTVFRGTAPEDFRLTTTAEREALLRAAGIDAVVTANFQPEFAELSPEGFVEDLLIKVLHARQVHVGYDFNFGKGRAGDTQSLEDLTRPHNVQTVVHAPIEHDDSVVSSTRVRAALAEGHLDQVNALLTQPLAIHGTTEAGAGRGKGMGIPTLNLYPSERLLPPHGVYATILNHDGVCYRAISNLGVRPTFEDDNRVSLETLSLEPFPIEARGLNIQVGFLEYIRPERRFEDPTALRAQIGIDVAAANAAHDAFEP